MVNSMEQLTFNFEDWGISPVITKEETTKKTTKKTTKEDNKTFITPCKIVTIHGIISLEEEGTFSLEEFRKKLSEKGCLEATNNNILPEKIKSGYVLALVEKPIQETISGEVDIVIGEEKISLEEGETPEEILKTLFPEYLGCSFAVDAKEKTLIPFWEEKISYDMLPEEFVLLLGFQKKESKKGDLWSVLQEECGIVKEDLPKDVTLEFSKRIIEGISYIFPSIVTKNVGKEKRKNKKEVKKEKETVEMFPLPLTLRVSFSTEDISLTPEMFDGEKEISATKIKEFLQNQYAVFQTAKTDFVFIKEKNLLWVGVSMKAKG